MRSRIGAEFPKTDEENRAVVRVECRAGKSPTLTHDRRASLNLSDGIEH